MTDAAARFAERLSLTPEGLADMRGFLAELSQDADTDYAALFEGLAQGQPLIAVLGLPAGSVDALYALAHAQFNAGRTHAALQLFQALTMLAPQVKDHWLGLGICLRITNGFEPAGQALEIAAALDPLCPAAAFHLAELRCRQSDWAAARAQVARFARTTDGPTKDRLRPEVHRLQVLIAGQKE